MTQNEKRILKAIIGTLIIGILLGGTIALTVLRVKDKPVKTQPLTDWKTNYFDAVKKVAALDDSVTALNDSVLAYKVKYGELGIELNRSETKLKNYSNQYRTAKPKRDTTSMVLACDSLLDELDYRYIIYQQGRESLADSLNQFYETIINFKDSSITVLQYSSDSLVIALKQYEFVNEQQAQQLEKCEQKKKGAIRFAWIGTGLAAITIFLNSIL